MHSIALLRTLERGRSVCVCHAIVSPAKTSEPIELPFGVWTRRNHVLYVGSDPPREGKILGMMYTRRLLGSGRVQSWHLLDASHATISALKGAAMRPHAGITVTTCSNSLK